MARPRQTLRRTADLHIRLTATERAVLSEEAYKAALTLSEFVRRRALGIRIVSRFDEHVLNELRRLGGLQKHLASKYPHQRAEADGVLKELIGAIKRLG